MMTIQPKKFNADEVVAEFKAKGYMTRNELGTALAQLRIEQGISIRKLAQLAHTSPRAVQATEKGWYNVGIDTYLAIASALGAKLQIKLTQRKRATK